MAISTGAPPHTLRGGLDSLNSSHHQLGLRFFLFIVVAHWAEHLVQAYQIYVMGWPIPEARGVLGIPFPWLVTSEWMHYGYALVMMVGLFLLRPGFTGRSGTWWKASLGIQVWHHLEHLLLLVQVLVGANLLGKAAPTSLVQADHAPGGTAPLLQHPGDGPHGGGDVPAHPREPAGQRHRTVRLRAEGLNAWPRAGAGPPGSCPCCSCWPESCCSG